MRAGQIGVIVWLLLAPSVLCQPASASPPSLFADPTTFLPAAGVVPGWQPTSDPLDFSRDTLWDHINGQAVHYLDYGFDRLAFVEYQPAEGAGIISVEVYAMAGRDHAFGVFASERTGGEEQVAVGDGGYLSEGTLNFWRGRCYVKLAAFDVANEASVLAAFASTIADVIPSAPGQPGLLELLPRAHRVPGSERFVPANVLALSFLRNGTLARYQRDDDHYQLFLVDLGSAAEVGEALLALEGFLRAQGYRIERTGEGAAPQVTAVREDVTVIFQHGCLIGGVLDADTKAAALAAARELRVSVEARP